MSLVAKKIDPFATRERARYQFTIDGLLRLTTACGLVFGLVALFAPPGGFETIGRFLATCVLLMFYLIPIILWCVTLVVLVRWVITGLRPRTRVTSRSEGFCRSAGSAQIGARPLQARGGDGNMSRLNGQHARRNGKLEDRL
ncbi:MAG: hypothetical protein VB835_17450 [Pirellulales bacterium]